MILILSEDGDSSALKVIKWLRNLKVEFIHLSEHETRNVVEGIFINGDQINIKIRCEGKIFNITDFKSIWCRRGHFMFSIPNPEVKIEDSSDIKSKIREHLNQEITTLSDFIYDFLNTKGILINDPRLYNFNKLCGLSIAIKSGLNVPPTVITDCNSNVKQVFKNNNDIITKNIQDVFSYHDENNDVIWSQQTFSLANTEIPHDQFFYSLFQENIRKEFEVRTFIFNNMIYSIAIFSQKNEFTKVDFRNYYQGIPNRMIPYKLPKDIELKLLRFMDLSNLFTGSIDMIYDGNVYYFLEVNPVGQFDFVSGYGNYPIEYDIAMYFKNL
jgi:ATP-GRASP peptide maturase of grasp-with-spasm system